MFTKLVFSLMFLVLPVEVLAQAQVAPPLSKPTKDVFAAELNSVITEASKIDDKLAMVNVKARAAALISVFDPVRSETIFLELWKFAKIQDEKDFEKERALSLILKHVWPRNRKLARQLMSDWPKGEEPSLGLRATGQDPVVRRATNLASQMVDENPREASEILEQNLSRSMTAGGLAALGQLRNKDTLLADLVVARIIEGLQTQPDILSLSGLQLLSDYVFPESSSIEFNSSLDSLQRQYFSTTYDTLRASLAETDTVLLRDRHYSEADLRFRAMYQATVSMTLAALAPRFRPDVTAELTALTTKLRSQLPPNVAELARYKTDRLSGKKAASDPAMAIPHALASGDFDEASRLIDEVKDDELRKTYSQLLAKLQVKAFLARADMIGALKWIRKVDDQSARLLLYLEVLKTARKNRDVAVTGLVVNEASTLIPQVDRNGLHVRALLIFASQLSSISTDEALVFLEAAVAAINSLPQRSDQTSATASLAELAWDEINDPRGFIDAVELDRAFAAIGGIDLDRAVGTAQKLQLKPVRLVARLEAVGEAIKVDARKPRSAPKIVARPRQ